MHTRKHIASVIPIDAKFLRQKLLSDLPTRIRFWRYCAPRCVVLKPESFSKFKDLEYIQVQTFLNQIAPVSSQSFSRDVTFTGGGILLQGHLVKYEKAAAAEAAEGEISADRSNLDEQGQKKKNMNRRKSLHERLATAFKGSDEKSAENLDVSGEPKSPVTPPKDYSYIGNIGNKKAKHVKGLNFIYPEDASYEVVSGEEAIFIKFPAHMANFWVADTLANQDIIGQFGGAIGTSLQIASLRGKSSVSTLLGAKAMSDAKARATGTGTFGPTRQSEAFWGRISENNAFTDAKFLE